MITLWRPRRPPCARSYDGSNGTNPAWPHTHGNEPWGVPMCLHPDMQVRGAERGGGGRVAPRLRHSPRPRCSAVSACCATSSGGRATSSRTRAPSLLPGPVITATRKPAAAVAVNPLFHEDGPRCCSTTVRDAACLAINAGACAAPRLLSVLSVVRLVMLACRIGPRARGRVWTEPRRVRRRRKRHRGADRPGAHAHAHGALQARLV